MIRITSLLQALRTYPLRQAQLTYEPCLDLTYRMESFQHDDWEFLNAEEICVMIRSRGGSKTFDFTNWLIFRVLRTQEKWAWLACKSGQLDQSLKYVYNNPFVKKIKTISNGKYDVILLSGDVIRFGIISTSNLGLRLDGIVYDEFEDLQIKQQEHIYPQMDGMLTNSRVHKTIYLGTLWTGCLLNDYSDKYPCKIRSWDTLPWLVEDGMIQSRIDAGHTPEWQIDLMYRCIATAPSGLFFDQSHLHILGQSDEYPLDFFETHNIKPNRNGVDFNGGDTGHVLLKAYWDGVNLYAFDEVTFGDKEIPKLHDYIEADHKNGIYTEVEGTIKMGSSAFNSGFADHLMTLNTNCGYNFWENNSKHIRLSLLQRSQLFVHPNCKWLIKNIKEGSYDTQLSRTNIGVSRLKKLGNQHGLDCAIHVCNSGGALDLYGNYTQPNSNFSNILALQKYQR